MPNPLSKEPQEKNSKHLMGMENVIRKGRSDDLHIFPVHKEQELQEENGLSVWVTADNMKAFVKLRRKVLPANVEKVLRTCGIKAHLDLDVLTNEKFQEEALEKQHEILVCDQGNLKQVVFDLHFFQNRRTLYRFLQGLYDGVREEKLPLINISAGTVIARRRTEEELKELRDIFDVFGALQDEQRRLVSLKVDKGLHEDDEGTITSSEDGHFKLSGNSLSVNPLFAIRSLEDWFQGDLRFIGSVEVGDQVMENFDIVAGHDITIKGCSDTSNLTAGGSIIVGEGILGQMTAQTRAKQLVKAGYINQSSVTCDHDIELIGGAFHSKVHAHGVLSAKSGSIVGGENYGAQGVIAKELGAVSGVKTLVAAGVYEEIPMSLDVVKEEMETIGLKLVELYRVVQPLLSVKNSGYGMDQSDRDLLHQSVSRIKALKERRSVLTAWVKDHSVEACLNARVDVLSKVYQGVTIMINNCRFEVKEELGRVSFLADLGRGTVMVKDLMLK